MKKSEIESVKSMRFMEIGVSKLTPLRTNYKCVGAYKWIVRLLHKHLLAADDVETTACHCADSLTSNRVDVSRERSLVEFNTVNAEADTVDNGIFEILHTCNAEVVFDCTLEEDFLAHNIGIVNDVQFVAEFCVGNCS